MKVSDTKECPFYLTNWESKFRVQLVVPILFGTLGMEVTCPLFTGLLPFPYFCSAYIIYRRCTNEKDAKTFLQSSVFAVPQKVQKRAKCKKVYFQRSNSRFRLVILA